jgi:hypothetical protein
VLELLIQDDVILAQLQTSLMRGTVEHVGLRLRYLAVVREVAVEGDQVQGSLLPSRYHVFAPFPDPPLQAGHGLLLLVLVVFSSDFVFGVEVEAILDRLL